MSRDTIRVSTLRLVKRSTQLRAFMIANSHHADRTPPYLLMEASGALAFVVILRLLLGLSSALLPS